MNTALDIEAGSIHHKILDRLCAAPKAVRGISEGMLIRIFGEPRALDELAQAKLIHRRGWHDGPGEIWLPTAEGETVCDALSAAEKNEVPQ
jgi:hypothetical protein